jgi:hypothetical protein
MKCPKIVKTEDGKTQTPVRKYRHRELKRKRENRQKNKTPSKNPETIKGGGKNVIKTHRNT